MRIPVIPEFYSNLPNSTRISSKEIIAIFGYKGYNVSQLISRGDIPDKTHSIKRKSTPLSGTQNLGKSFYWTLGSIRRLRIKMLKELENNEQ